MKVGICLPHYGGAMEPDRMREFAERVEALGFDSLWVTDHVIVPADLQIVYKEGMLDPLATLSFLAGVTSRVQLGTSVIILPYRHPVHVAKSVASADALSGGRVLFGAAAGWMEGEFATLNAEFVRRGDVSDESLRLIRELWTNPRPDFQGEFYTAKDVVFSPSTVSEPHPPILVGGRSRRAMRRAVELGDGWHPNVLAPDELREATVYVKELSDRNGRATPPWISMRSPVYFDATSGEGRTSLWGSTAQIVNVLKQYEDVGVEHMAISFADSSLDQMLEQVDRLADEVMPKVAS
ncbi:MAG: LLM class F420-dependent oxidoreductase [Chloroflexi bacterium]|nr:LLM class F420-dependent oxidoreductase [Chloroflexota bacterium]